MTTIRQLIYSSPKRANELFAKLVDTSETAVKTRDRLLSELKDELELHAELEEQHLFPVLKKHQETRGLAADALNDNRQTRKLLAELESIPKNSEEFAIKVAELKKVFQQHVRDEKKELLPAVKKALSDEEVSTVVEKIEDEKAQLEAAQRAEAEERRAKAKAKREREQADAKRERAQAANAAKGKVKADGERVQNGTPAAQTTTVARGGADGNEQSEAARRPGADRDVAGAGSQTARIVEAGVEMAQQGAKAARLVTTASAGEASATSSEETKTAVAGWSMVDLLNEQAQHAVDATRAVAGARTPADVVKAQSDFINGSLQRMAQFNSRYIAFVRGGMLMSFPPSRR